MLACHFCFATDEDPQTGSLFRSLVVTICDRCVRRFAAHLEQAPASPAAGRGVARPARRYEQRRLVAIS